MLKVPAFAYYAEHRVTAYQDDTEWWKFYLVPDHPEIRRDEAGNPVFLLVKYAFGDQDRAEIPDLPRGGGYLAFDCELALSKEAEAAVTALLQEQVEAIWKRLVDEAAQSGAQVSGYRMACWAYVNGMSANSRIGVNDLRLGLSADSPLATPSEEAPKVVLAQPTWIDGTFEISAPTASTLVSQRVTSGQASLVGRNTAAVSMELTAPGATFMEKALVNPDGSGGADSTPVQVTYHLKHWARIPPAKVFIRADSRQLYQGIKTVFHDYDDNCADTDDVTHIDQALSLAVDSGLIEVVVDTGTLPLESEFAQQLNDLAMSTVKDLIREHFFVRGERTLENGETDGLLDANKDVYYVKQISDFSAVSFQHTVTIHAIQPWKANPQGTMQAFFAGMPATEVRKYVRVVDLDDSFFKTLGLSATAYVDWEKEPIDFVELQLRYRGRDELGQNVEKAQTFTLTKDKPRDQWDPSLIGAKREYEWRYRVGYRGAAPSEYTAWQPSTSPEVNLPVSGAGKVEVKVLAGDIDWPQTMELVQIDISYDDSSQGIAEESTTLQLSPTQQEATYQRYIFRPWDKPARMRTRYFMKNRRRMETEWQPIRQKQIYVNEPFFDSLDVQFVPAGGWTDVMQAVISCRYHDAASQYTSEATLALKSADEFRVWTVPLMDTSVRGFEYKVIMSFKDGTSTETAWIQGESDQAIRVHAAEVPRLRVKLLADLVKFDLTPVVEVTLRYDEGASHPPHIRTFVFTASDKGMVDWSLPISNASPRSYTVQTRYHRRDGRVVAAPIELSDREVFTIPPLDVPQVSCSLMATLLRFEETPVVEVNVEYSHPEGGIEEAETFVFTANDRAEKVWRIEVLEDSPKGVTLYITYYLADGSPVEMPPIHTNRNKVVIPRYQAAGDPAQPVEPVQPTPVVPTPPTPVDPPEPT